MEEMPMSPELFNWLKYALYLAGTALVTVVGLHYRYILADNAKLKIEIDAERAKETGRQQLLMSELMKLKDLARMMIEYLNDKK